MYVDVLKLVIQIETDVLTLENMPWLAPAKENVWNLNGLVLNHIVLDLIKKMIMQVRIFESNVSEFFTQAYFFKY